MGLGKLLYKLYYRPKSLITRLKKTGVLNSIEISRQQDEMLENALLLKEIYNPQLPVYQVYFLTGKKYWYQTAFCLYSLQKNSKAAQFLGIFVDDGTISPALASEIMLQFPNSRLILNHEIEAVLDNTLPRDKYPVIRNKRATYPHLKKLTDIHAGSAGWKLVLDSDMLFFNHPDMIVKWLKSPRQPLFLYDSVTSYHYSIALMQNLAEQKVLSNINVGIAGLNSESIDWDKLELWIAELEKKEGSSYLLEQALTAMLVGENVIFTDKNNYIVLPEKQEVKDKKGILQHYVADSKSYYYTIGWKHFKQPLNA